MGKFDDLVKSATTFVEQHKGTWKHYEWIAFMTDVKKKGMDINFELQNNIGTMLNSLKEYLGYAEGEGKAVKPLKDLSESVAKFIKETKGKWDHTAWEAFLTDLSKKGIDLSERATSYIGNVLESAKNVYVLSPKEDSSLVKAASREVVEVKPKEVAVINSTQENPVESASENVKASTNKGKKARKPS